jgi:hypothetical protein
MIKQVIRVGSYPADAFLVLLDNEKGGKHAFTEPVSSVIVRPSKDPSNIIYREDLQTLEIGMDLIAFVGLDQFDFDTTYKLLVESPYLVKE